MSLVDLLFGRPLSSREERSQQIGALAGIPIFGLDALSSAAYGPEAALTLMIPLGVVAPAYLAPITLSIVILLSIVYFSYRQTIAAYPTGGGSYTVARQNLGVFAGLLAAAALLTDYVLTAAVGISAGVGALVSAVPGLQPYTLGLCLLILLAITIVNLRGVREAGVVFLLPTYLFVGTMFAALVLGAIKTLLAGGQPVPVVAPPRLPQAREAISLWILLKAFSSGCTAMTGVEAVSNGVKAFREPVVESARRTLTIIIGILILMLAGIAWLARVYQIGATEPGQAGYQSVLSQLIAAVAGKGIFYYLTIAGILLVLAFSANTAFADFPRLCRAIAQNCYLPSSFASRGRRLVYSQGIWVLAFLTGLLLVMFGGVTDRLIPLFAVGAFLAFTLSQAGMVAHWKRTGGPHARHSMLINGLGALATAITVCVVAVAKFAEGAWVTVLLIPGLMVLMTAVRRHYHRVTVETASPSPLEIGGPRPPLIVVPIEHWNRISKKALRIAFSLSTEVQAVHVEVEDEPDALRSQWAEYVEEPAKRAGLQPPALVALPSPYRFVLYPILNHVLALEKQHPDRYIAVLLPALVESRWYYYFLHKQRAELLTALLLLRGTERTVVIQVPWYLWADVAERHRQLPP